jgi:hypothetical protein
MFIQRITILKERRWKFRVLAKLLIAIKSSLVRHYKATAFHRKQFREAVRINVKT